MASAAKRPEPRDSSLEGVSPAADRRSHRRYEVDLQLRYWFVDAGTPVPGGRGRTLNISSNGILFQAAEAVAPGKEIELSVDWPHGFDDIAGMALRVTGRTVRGHDNCTAVITERYEFKTRMLRRSG